MEQGKMTAQQMLDAIKEMMTETRVGFYDVLAERSAASEKFLLTNQVAQTERVLGLLSEIHKMAKTQAAPEMPFVWNRKIQMPDGDTIYTVRAWTFAELETRKAEILAALPAPLALPADRPAPQRWTLDREEELLGEDNHQDNGAADLSQPTAEGTCPKCDGAIWDNRGDTNRPANTPLIKCRDREGCGWAVWAKKPRTGGDAARANAKKARLVTGRF